MTDNTSNISHIVNKDDLYNALVALSKKEAPELDNMIHHINAMLEINNILGLKPTEKDIEYMEELRHKTEQEKNLLYENIKIEGTPVDGIPSNEDEKNAVLENKILS